MTNEKYGFTGWSDSVGTPRSDRPATNNNNADRIQFARLQKGNNNVRIVTKPAPYKSVRFKADANEKGFGKRVVCSAPTDECPSVKAGFRPKTRWLVGVIDRRDNEIRILDLSYTTYQQLKAWNEDIEWGSPEGYDVNIRMNPDAKGSGYYTVMPRGKAALSQADLDLIEKKRENLEASILRLVTPPKVETVMKRLEGFGYKGGVVAQPVSNGSGKELEETDDDDYSFDQNSNVAQA